MKNKLYNPVINNPKHKLNLNNGRYPSGLHTDKVKPELTSYEPD